MQEEKVHYVRVAPNTYAQPSRSTQNYQVCQFGNYGATPSPTPSTQTSTNRRRSIPATGVKPCNCSKSACLKLYCECFARGAFCDGCKCKDCHNNMEFEHERTKAIKQCIERNPNAFQPKIVSATRGRETADRTHLKGCHCKKSNCLKNYCECYEAKVACTDRCKCQMCKNTEHDRHEKGMIGVSQTMIRRQSAPAPVPYAHSAQQGLMNLAAAAADMQYASNLIDDDPAIACSSLSMQPSSTSHNGYTEPDASQQQRNYNNQIDPKTQPYYYMNDDVVEATALCLTSVADDMIRKRQQEPESSSDQSSLDADVEFAILQEFGRCLNQIISNARNYSTLGTSTSTDAGVLPLVDVTTLEQNQSSHLLHDL